MPQPVGEQAVEELIRVVEALKEKRGHWYTLGIPINHYYSYEEQLQAIDRLGDSRSPRALEYLTRASEVLVNTKDQGRGMSTTYIWHPNLKGALGRAFSRTCGATYAHAPNPDERRLSEAVSKLRRSLSIKEIK